MKKSPPAATVLAISFTTMALAVGYLGLGLVPMLLFAFGFVGGLVVWLLVPTQVSFRRIRAPYALALLLFAVHKIEEHYSGFFPALSEITGVPVPEVGSLVAIMLNAVGVSWLLVPILIKRGIAFGYYLAWTFFTSMGITELAHFVLPLVRGEPYGYFPGMASVIPLAPVAWVGLARLARGSCDRTAARTRTSAGSSIAAQRASGAARRRSPPRS